ncbi:hypothetical protein [Nonomuraea dietziae]
MSSCACPRKRTSTERSTRRPGRAGRDPEVGQGGGLQSGEDRAGIGG